MEKRLFSRCIIFLLILGLLFPGCARQKELERINRSQAATILSLNDEIKRLNDELEELSQAKEDLAATKVALEKKLKEELGKGDLSVSMNSRGLVVTVLNKILFDSGKATLKDQSINTLNKVGEILNKEVPNQMIYVEGHTDNDPIKFSGFKSNWELSTARATEVVHYFIDKDGVNAERLVASGYGEFNPVASNATASGKSMNRRVEIIISPHKVIKKEFQDQ